MGGLLEANVYHPLTPLQSGFSYTSLSLVSLLVSETSAQVLWNHYAMLLLQVIHGLVGKAHYISWEFISLQVMEYYQQCLQFIAYLTEVSCLGLV